MRITDPRLTPPGTWRTKWYQALFRSEIFFVETDSTGSGRRVAVHEYPKRNVPYAEDMGRAARTYQVQGYLIGPFYHELKERLITALEKDGPGRLRLPMYQDVEVMVQSYTVSENRERGGFCTIQMQFVEYGDPEFRANISTPGQVMERATGLENRLLSQQTITPQMKKEMEVFAEIHKSADVPN
jgi:hypothetical protein